MAKQVNLLAVLSTLALQNQSQRFNQGWGVQSSDVAIHSAGTWLQQP